MPIESIPLKLDNCTPYANISDAQASALQEQIISYCSNKGITRIHSLKELPTKTIHTINDILRSTEGKEDPVSALVQGIKQGASYLYISPELKVKIITISGGHESKSGKTDEGLQPFIHTIAQFDKHENGYTLLVNNQSSAIADAIETMVAKTTIAEDCARLLQAKSSIAQRILEKLRGRRGATPPDIDLSASAPTTQLGIMGEHMARQSRPPQGGSSKHSR